MPVLLFYVSEDAGRWKLRANFHTRWFETREAAMAAAMAAARSAATLGNRAQVLLPGPDGEFHPVWDSAEG